MAKACLNLTSIKFTLPYKKILPSSLIITSPSRELQFVIMHKYEC